MNHMLFEPLWMGLLFRVIPRCVNAATKGQRIDTMEEHHVLEAFKTWGCCKL
jgi:hypothetical protein